MWKGEEATASAAAVINNCIWVEACFSDKQIHMWFEAPSLGVSYFSCVVIRAQYKK